MTKEQLEEMIKNKKDIWCYYVADKTIEKLNNDFDFGKYKIEEENLILGNYEWYFPLRYLFSTKEEAQHYKDNGNVSRTEKLPYVTWEEFKNGKVITFITKYGLQVRMCKGFFDDEISLFVGQDVNTVKLNEDNYYKMYRVLNNLFTGEYEV